MDGEFFDQVKNELTAYAKSLGKVGELQLVGIISRLLGLFLLIFALLLCLLALFTFGAVALIDVMTACMPLWAASLIVGAAYLVLIIVAIACRKPLFVHPFIKLLTKEIKTEEELQMQTMEAEHQADMQRVRIECQVENATREINFYANMLSRTWNVVRSWLRRK